MSSSSSGLTSSEAPSPGPSGSLSNIEAGISGGGGGVIGGEGWGSTARGLWRHTLSSPGFGVNVSKVPIVTLFFFLEPIWWVSGRRKLRTKIVRVKSELMWLLSMAFWRQLLLLLWTAESPTLPQVLR
jgi:hypothetical protein